MDREPGEPLAQHAELPVLRPEVVAPLADAVRLVHREERRIGARQLLGEAVHDQALRRDVEQVVAAGAEAAEHLRALRRRLAAVEVRGGHACLAKTVDLVLHERDERRDDDGQALQMRGGRLVAERFAAARGEHDDGIAPVEDGGDGFALQRKEAVVAPDTPYGLVNELRLDDANIIADRGLPVPAFVANRMSGRVSIFRSAASAVATASPAAAGGGGSARRAVRGVQRAAGGGRGPPDFPLRPARGRTTMPPPAFLP